MGGQPWRLVLTGAAGGIGAAFAQALAPHCVSMVLVGRDAAALEALRARLGCGLVRVVAGDLAQEATLAAVGDAAGALGGVDLLINNAGVNAFHDFQTQDAASLRSMLDINLLAPMLLTQRLLPQLRAAPRAQVVNVGSLFGYLGYPGFAGYCASKAGLRAFTQALRRELADTGIAARHFIPRATRTPINAGAVDALNAEMGVPVDQPQDVARQLLAFLDGAAWERKAGLREALLVLVNQLLPALPDRAIRGQLAVIQRHMPGHSRRQTTRSS
ncbi:SDR family oxidoreductase [Telluria beijingensis]|uniref:SDR family oxidoreductase n=1 Tax=Telluria beijingensis TaxID=3068633 RepID=UPI002795FF70|nr:SDR family oxidoreductase [Massilia sp. REN29]